MLKYLQIFCLCVALKISSAFAQNKLVVSIDCGSNETYIDSIGITWQSDSSYINSGKIATIAAGPNSTFAPLPRRFTTLRYFPTFGQKKNCYPLPRLEQARKYLLRASFYYGNYDGKSSPPSFSLQFDGNHWDNVVTYLDKEAIYELTYVVKTKSTGVCIARTSDDQIPFISSIEVRSLELTMYKIESMEDVLFTYVRTSFGLPAVLRYPDDLYDRIWYPSQPIAGLVSVRRESDVLTELTADNPPAKALLNAVTPSPGATIAMTMPSPVRSTTPLKIFFNMYYVEVSKAVAANNSRSFEFTIDGTYVSGPISPLFDKAIAWHRPAVNMSGNSVLKWVNDPGSTAPPLINALEFFVNRNGLTAGTLSNDVEGLKLLQGSYEQLQSWGGDPCLPAGFAWEWINCAVGDPARVKALILREFGLNVSLPDFSSMDALETVDLSNNSLSGNIPDFLGKLPCLKELNLAFNHFVGHVPSSLTNKRSLKLNFTGNSGLIMDDTNPGRGKLHLIVGASVGSALLLLLLIATGVLYIRCWRDKYGKVCLRWETNRAFSYQDIVGITNNFETLIGKGGSGDVYYGRLINKTEVAVKVITHGQWEFVVEVKLLMTIHQKNLVSFFGFCEEGNNKIVLYEYMAKGNLGQLLTGKRSTSETLSWKKRVEIALDVAKGLKYLHTGCSPPIIHRDVKPANILLNAEVKAKLADFGISKSAGNSPVELNQEATEIVGTPGYIDPEYSDAFLLTSKSDVYSFGIVLFELVCGKPALFGPREAPLHIASWATSTLSETRDVDSIIDPRIRGQANSKSVWKVAGLAMACTEIRSANRPDMHDVVNQLKEALEMVTDENYHDTPSMRATSVLSMSVDGSSQTCTESWTYPSAR